MPVQRCQVDDKPGWRCGQEGNCYGYTAGDAASEKRAKKRAIDQCLAIGEDPGAAAVDVSELNRLLVRGRARAEELEPRLRDLLVPILNRAADEAARKFSATAPSLTAAGNPPQWVAPGADELIDVAAFVRLLQEKTEPVRRAFIQRMMTDALEAAGLSWDVTNPFIG